MDLQPATRHGDMWVGRISQHGVYGYGRTLRALHNHLTQGLALIDVTTNVKIIPAVPGLDRLRRAEAAYEAALSDTVTTLTALGSTTRDIAEATGVPIARITALRSKPKTLRARTPRKRKPDVR